jgi:acyl dehydratase
MKFADFSIGQIFEARITISSQESDTYMSLTKIRNLLLENRELAEEVGIKEPFISGRRILARAEGEMTRLDAFSNNVMMLYGMDGDPSWNNRQTRFLGVVHPGEELLVKYVVSNKVEGDDRSRGILSIDLEIHRAKDHKLVIISRRNLYSIKN